LARRSDNVFSCCSEVPARSDAVLQEGFDHPGSGLGTSARFPERDAAAAKVTTAGGYSLSAITALQTHQSASLFRSR